MSTSADAWHRNAEIPLVNVGRTIPSQVVAPWLHSNPHGAAASRPANRSNAVGFRVAQAVVNIGTSDASP